MKFNEILEAEGLRARYQDPEPVKIEDLPEMDRLTETEKALGLVPEEGGSNGGE